MSLSDRTKELFSGSQQQSDPEYRPPGAFPTDDMAPGDAATAASTSHQRNRLHKPTDPRAQGHGHGDSGVGLPDSNEPALTREPVENAYAPAEGYDQRREHAKRSDVAEFDDVKADQRDTTQYGVDPRDLGTTVGTTGAATGVRNTADDDAGRNVVRSGGQKSNIDHKDPYWGDLPQGQGVYNTVAGHGSNSDEARRYQVTDDSADHRSFPLVTDRTRQHHDDPVETRQGETSHDQQKSSSHWKEGAAGAAVTGAAGTAAYKATRDDEDRRKDAHSEETAEDDEKKGRGGLFGVFHRGSKSDKDNEHHHKEHQKLTKDHKAAPVAAAGFASSREDKRQDEQRYQDQNLSDNTRSARNDPAVAAAAVAYSQRTDDHHATSSSRYNDPASRGNEGQYNTLPSGTNSGVRAGDSDVTGTRNPLASRQVDDNKESNRNAAVYGTAGAAAALGAGGYAAHEMRKDRNDEDCHPLNTNTQEPPRSGGWFTSPATNTTTTTTTTSRNIDPAQSQRAAYASEDASKRSGFVAAPIPGTATRSTREPTTDNYTSATGTGTGISQPSGFVAGAGAGAAMGSRKPVSDHYTTAASTGTSQPSMRQSSSEVPRATEEANEGHYNTLSSGTPSGVKLG